VELVAQIVRQDTSGVDNNPNCLPCVLHPYGSIKTNTVGDTCNTGLPQRNTQINCEWHLWYSPESCRRQPTSREVSSRASKRRDTEWRLVILFLHHWSLNFSLKHIEFLPPTQALQKCIHFTVRNDQMYHELYIRTHCRMLFCDISESRNMGIWWFNLYVGRYTVPKIS
jgi:hypothetical protein